MKSLFLSEGEFLFEDTNMEDWGVGLILLFISLFMLCGCLVGLVKILNSMMKGIHTNAGSKCKSLEKLINLITLL